MAAAETEMSNLSVDDAEGAADTSGAPAEYARVSSGISDRRPTPNQTPNSPPVRPTVQRTDEEKRQFFAKLIEFYKEYNPDFLVPGPSGDPDDIPNVQSIVDTTTPEIDIWRALHQKYLEVDSDEEMPAHPSLQEEGAPRQRTYRKRGSNKKGGDGLANKYSDYTMALLRPVSVTMIIVVWACVNFTPIYEGRDQEPLYMAWSERSHSSASTGEKLGGSLANALIVVGFFTVITFIMVLLYKYNCMNVIKCWLVMSSGVILFLIAAIWFDLFCVKYQIPYDYITMLVMLWNFGIVGCRVIYFVGHPKMTQAYLVATSAIMAWFLSRFPEYTTWTLLAAISLYDLYAVLTPKGPLNQLVAEAQKRDEPLPGLVYESKSYKLGLGDFVFYSLLVGRASFYSYTAWSFSFIAILSGLCGTLFCLGVFDKPLPALPISIFSAMIVYFLTRYLVVDYVIDVTFKGVYY